eukprot:scaffold12605_cov114-Isochrysis_galbana.AAC.1
MSASHLVHCPHRHVGHRLCAVEAIDLVLDRLLAPPHLCRFARRCLRLLLHGHAHHPAHGSLDGAEDELVKCGANGRTAQRRRDGTQQDDQPCHLIGVGPAQQREAEADGRDAVDVRQ